MTIGTWWRTTSARSASRRLFERWTMRLTANGAAGRSGLAEVNAALDSAISSSQSVSIEAGRALRLGKEPTTPAWHWALTSSGPEAMNMGEPKTGRRSWESRSEREFTVPPWVEDRKSTRLNSSHVAISYAVFCLKKKKETH